MEKLQILGLSEDEAREECAENNMALYPDESQLLAEQANNL
jgi:hypothetical protein